MSQVPLSVVVITLNEEKTLERCLQHLPSGVELVVLDSGSTDQTVSIAKRFGAVVYERLFDNYAAQKNAAIAFASRAWILSLDADEVLTLELQNSILKIVQEEKSKKYLAYTVSRSLVYMGQRLRFGKTQDHPIRLFQRGKTQFEGAIHEKLIVNAAVGSLDGDLLHYSYQNLDDYFARFNSYTKRIALNHFQKKKSVVLFLHVLRPWMEFLYRYFIRLGFLDGMAGYSYALISSLYTFVKYEKLREIYLQKKSNNVE